MPPRTAVVSSFLVAGAALGTVLLAAAGPDAAAGRSPRRTPRAPEPALVSRVESPLGRGGIDGSGANVVIPFTLVDARHARTDVEVQYGVDANGDGTVDEEEYLPATEDRLDPRDTRSNRIPQKFGTSGGLGAAHAFVWRSTADVPSGRYEMVVYRTTDQGRLVPDGARPGQFLLDDVSAGVRVRIRAVRTWRRKTIVGAWTVSEPFPLSNNRAPAMTIDQASVGSGAQDVDGPVELRWTAFDRDTEDLNGNGRFEPAAGEDLNGNGRFEQEQVGVAFDFHRLQPDEDPATLSRVQLDRLTWQPCTRAPGLGDTDSLREPAPGAGQTDRRAFASPGGRSWTFVWDAFADLRGVPADVIFRARAVDAKRELSDHAYLTEPVTLGR